MSRNLTSLGDFQYGRGDDCLLYTDIFPDGGRSQNLDRLGVPHIDMVEITRSSTSVLYMNNYDLHKLNRYEYKL